MCIALLHFPTDSHHPHTRCPTLTPFSSSPSSLSAALLALLHDSSPLHHSQPTTSQPSTQLTQELGICLWPLGDSSFASGGVSLTYVRTLLVSTSTTQRQRWKDTRYTWWSNGRVNMPHNSPPTGRTIILTRLLVYHRSIERNREVATTTSFTGDPVHKVWLSKECMERMSFQGCMTLKPHLLMLQMPVDPSHRHHNRATGCMLSEARKSVRGIAKRGSKAQRGSFLSARREARSLKIESQCTPN